MPPTSDELPHPFKVIQTDRVFRAERPQKGRLREFVQCDIDILGDASPNAEVELIDVTTRALLKHRLHRLYRQHQRPPHPARDAGEAWALPADTLDSVCITFDKMDKIGAEGVKAELTEKQLCRGTPSTHWTDFMRRRRSHAWTPWPPRCDGPRH